MLHAFSISILNKRRRHAGEREQETGKLTDEERCTKGDRCTKEAKKRGSHKEEVNAREIRPRYCHLHGESSISQGLELDGCELWVWMTLPLWSSCGVD